MSYSPAELMTVMAARQLVGVGSVFAGVGSPLLAAALAQKTHSPDLTIVVEGGSVGPELVPGRLPISTNEMRVAHRARMLPGITDDAHNINAVAQAAAEHKAQFIGANVLFLKPGSKEWFMPFIREAYPYLAPGYEKLYRNTYAPAEYTKAVLRLVDDSRHQWGLPARATATTPAKERRGAQGQLFALAAV